MLAVRLLLVAGIVAFAVTMPAQAAQESPPQQQVTPQPGQQWVKIRYELDKEGEPISCQVIETTASKRTSDTVCNMVLNSWKFEPRKRARESFTHLIVINPDKP